MSGDARVKGKSNLKNRNRKRALLHELEKQEYQEEQKLLLTENDGLPATMPTSRASTAAASASNKKVREILLQSTLFKNSDFSPF